MSYYTNVDGPMQLWDIASKDMRLSLAYKWALSDGRHHFLAETFNVSYLLDAWEPWWLEFADMVTGELIEALRYDNLSNVEKLKEFCIDNDILPPRYDIDEDTAKTSLEFFNMHKDRIDYIKNRQINLTVNNIPCF